MFATVRHLTEEPEPITGAARQRRVVAGDHNRLSTGADTVASSEVRELSNDEVDTVSGGFIIGVIIAAELFAIGFAGGVVACNVANDRPWYEF